MSNAKEVAPVIDAEVVSDTAGQPGTEIEPFVNEQGEVLIHGEAAARLAALLATVPVDDESGNQRIAEQLLEGGNLLDLNKPWDSSGGRALAGKQLRIDAIKGRPSRYPGGLRAFLVAEYVDTQTGERGVMTTSAMAPVIQLARVSAEGWLPAYCVVEVADRATERGFFPYHLRFTPPPASVQS